VTPHGKTDVELMANSQVVIFRSAGCTKTVGLEATGQRNVDLCYVDENLAGTARDLLVAIVTYHETSGKPINAGDKMGWATSVIRFDERDDVLRATALDLHRDEFIAHLDELLTAWQLQKDTCKEAGSRYDKTELQDMIVVSPDVLKGDPVAEAIRYPHRAPNSGWWLFGTNYNGDPLSMRRVYVGDLLMSRRDMNRYLALESGFCFSQQRALPVWFEDMVAFEEPN
jgi:hypothetical protein